MAAEAQGPGLLPELIVIDDSSSDESDDDDCVILTPLPPAPTAAVAAAAAAAPAAGAVGAAAAAVQHDQEHYMEEDNDGSYDGEGDEEDEDDYNMETDYDSEEEEYAYASSQHSSDLVQQGGATLGHTLLNGYALCRHELSEVFGKVDVQQWTDVVRVTFSLHDCRWAVKLHLSAQNPKTIAKTDVEVGPLVAGKGGGGGGGGKLVEQMGRVAALRRLFDRYLLYAIDAGGREVDTTAFTTLVENGLTAAYSHRNQLLQTHNVAFADPAAIHRDAARINERLRAAVRQQNPLRRVLCVMQLLIESTWEWCACCGRLDDLQARGAHADPVVVPDRAGSCTADTCGFLFTSSEDLIHAAEETIRIGPHVFRFLLTVMSAAASHDAEALFSHVPIQYHLGLSEGGETRVNYALLRRDLQALEGALTWRVVEDALYLPSSLRRRQRQKKEEEASRHLREEGLQRMIKTKQQMGGAVAAAAAAAEAAAAAAMTEAEEEEKALATDKETLLKRLFVKLFKDRGTEMYKLYWWVLKAYNTSFVRVPLDRLRSYNQAHQEQLGGPHRMVPEHPQRVDLFTKSIDTRFQQNGKSNLCLLELKNDRRPSKLAFERLVGEAMARQEEAERGFWGARQTTAQLGWSFHGSHKHKWHSLLTLGVLKLSGTRHMSTGQAYGAGVYTSPHLDTSLQYAGHHPHQISPNGGAVAIVEYLTGDGTGASFLKSNNPHIVISEERAVSIKFLLLALPEAKEGEGEKEEEGGEEEEEEGKGKSVK